MLAVSFRLTVLITMFGPISGAHFNPAVSIVMTMTGRLTPKEYVIYIPMQVAGGIGGVLLSRMMFFNKPGLNKSPR